MEANSGRMTLGIVALSIWLLFDNIIKGLSVCRMIFAVFVGNSEISRICHRGRYINALI